MRVIFFVRLLHSLLSADFNRRFLTVPCFCQMAIDNDYHYQYGTGDSYLFFLIRFLKFGSHPIKLVTAAPRKNTLFCRAAFYFFSFCPNFTLRWKQVANTKRLTGLWPLPKRPQITRFIPLIPPYEQPFRQKEKKSNAQWQKRKIFSSNAAFQLKTVFMQPTFWDENLKS